VTQSKDYYDGLREGVSGFTSAMLASIADVDPDALMGVTDVRNWIGGTAQLILDSINEEEKNGYVQPAPISDLS
jgi:hypothetical protein